MIEKASIPAKVPETKKENSGSAGRDAEFSHSIGSPIESVLFLQKTIGNKAVRKCVASNPHVFAPGNGMLLQKKKYEDQLGQRKQRTHGQFLRTKPKEVIRAEEESAVEQSSRESGAAIELKQQIFRWKVPPRNYGLFIIGYAAEITLDGKVSYGQASTEFSFTRDQAKAEISQSLGQVFGADLKLEGTIAPGKDSKIGIAIGNELIEVDFSAQADLLTPFQLGIEQKIPVVSKRIGNWMFTGDIRIRLEINMAPSPTLVARFLTRGLGRVAKAAVRGIYATVRGGYLLVKGWVLEVGAAGAAAAVAGGLATGFAIYLLGIALPQAGREAGLAQGMVLRFVSGYARMLAELTSLRRPDQEIEFPRSLVELLLTLNWADEFKQQLDQFIEKRGRDEDIPKRMFALGMAASLQTVRRFVKGYGDQAWLETAKEHRENYGSAKNARAGKYRKLLLDQLSTGNVVGIAPLTE